MVRLLGVLGALSFVLLTGCFYSSQPLSVPPAALSSQEYPKAIKGDWKLEEFHGKYSMFGSDFSNIITRLGITDNAVVFAKENGLVPSRRETYTVNGNKIELGKGLTVSDKPLDVIIVSVSKDILLLQVNLKDKNEMVAQLRYSRRADFASEVTLDKKMLEEVQAAMSERLVPDISIRDEVFRVYYEFAGDVKDSALSKIGLQEKDHLTASAGKSTEIYGATSDLDQDWLNKVTANVLSEMKNPEGTHLTVERRSGDSLISISFFVKYE